MARAYRSDSWGFPRWGGYGGSREATQVRLCDRTNCHDKGDCPAPKSPNHPDRWYFCVTHAAEYNRGWDYFAGLTAEEAAMREANETRDNSGFKEAAHYSWGGPGDGSRSRDEMRSLELLELESDADFDAIKKSYRAKAKLVHPDLHPGDGDAAKAFHALQLAYEVLRQADGRRQWKG